MAGVSGVGLPTWGSALGLLLQPGRGQPPKPETPGDALSRRQEWGRAGERVGGFKFKGVLAPK